MEKNIVNSEEDTDLKDFLEMFKKDFLVSSRYLSFDANNLLELFPKIYENLLKSPAETIDNIQTQIEARFDVKLKLHFYNINNSKNIHTIRAEDIGKFISTKGIIKRVTKVIPRVTSIHFECPACGTILKVLQDSKKKIEPRGCSCGKRAGFKILAEDTTDIQEINLEEIQDDLNGKQPQQIRVYIENELTEVNYANRLRAGRKIEVIGEIKKLPAFMTVKDEELNISEFMIHANNLIPLEQEEDETVTEKDIEQIREIAFANPLKKLSDNLAPEVFGNEMVKKALVLQMVRAVAKPRSDGSMSKEDLNLLLSGDVGIAKSLTGDSKIFYTSSKNNGYIALSDLYELSLNEEIKVLTIDTKSHNPKWAKVACISKHLPDQRLVKITCENGKQVTGTEDHSFLTLNNQGEIVETKGTDLTIGSYVPLPKHFHIEKIRTLNIGEKKKINLDFNAGFFFGIFLAEGYARRSVTAISSNNKKTQDRVVSFARDNGMSFSLIGKDKGVAVNSRELADFLKLNCCNQKQIINIKKGIKGNYSAIKKIPDFVYFSPKNFIWGVLSGLFSGDGFYENNRKNDVQGTASISITTISKELIENTSELLYSIGIANKTRREDYYYRGEKRYCYNLTILNTSFAKFRKKLIFYGRNHFKISDKSIDYFNTLPVGDLLYALSKKLGYNSRKEFGEKRTIHTMMRNVRNGERIGAGKVRKLLKQFYYRNKEVCNSSEEFKKLKRIVYSNIMWSKITNLESIDGSNEYVYDIEIPETNTFVANGIGVHNTRLLSSVIARTPRGKLIVGTKTSRVGLGAMCVKDELTNTWALEVGNLVLCNGTTLGIDELDKMYKEHLSELLEPMAEGKVSINRAGISAVLPARTSILASANPIHGNYDLNQPLAKQIDLPSPILNRFDLIFIMLDKPNQEFDFNIVSHIFQSMNEKPVLQISIEFFKKYVAYCRKLTPRLKPELLEQLQRFYVSIRQGSQVKESGDKGIPINIRNLEGVIRLAEAHAKLRLSEWVEPSDLDVAKEIFMFSLKQIGIDNETGLVDTSRVFSKIPSSRRGKVETLLDAISKLAQENNNYIPLNTIRSTIDSTGIKAYELYDFLEELKKAGRVFEPKTGFFSLL